MKKYTVIEIQTFHKARVGNFLTSMFKVDSQEGVTVFTQNKMIKTKESGAIQFFLFLFFKIYFNFNNIGSSIVIYAILLEPIVI